jgi:hypothetical protein
MVFDREGIALKSLGSEHQSGLKKIRRINSSSDLRFISTGAFRDRWNRPIPTEKS